MTGKIITQKNTTFEGAKKNEGSFYCEKKSSRVTAAPSDIKVFVAVVIVAVVSVAFSELFKILVLN